jgi:hypothetical protein
VKRLKRTLGIIRWFIYTYIVDDIGVFTWICHQVVVMLINLILHVHRTAINQCTTHLWLHIIIPHSAWLISVIQWWFTEFKSIKQLIICSIFIIIILSGTLKFSRYTEKLEVLFHWKTLLKKLLKKKLNNYWS